MDFQVIESTIAELSEYINAFAAVADLLEDAEDHITIEVETVRELSNLISGLEGDVSSVRSIVEDAAAEASNLQSYANDVESTLSYLV